MEWLALLILAVVGAGIYVRQDGVSKPENSPGNLFEDSIKPAPERQKNIYTSSDIHNLSDKEIFARTLYGEGRSLSNQEVRLIAWVIRNRVTASWYPNTFKNVCLQQAQFSCWNGLNKKDPQGNEKEVRKIILSDQYNYTRVRQIAEDIITASPDQNPIPGTYNFLLKRDPRGRQNVELSGKKVVSAYASWAVGMVSVADPGKHIFLSSGGGFA